MTDVELIGPMAVGGHYDVAIDGFLVPYVKVEGGGSEWAITIRDQLCFDLMIDRSGLEQVLRLLACGMAVAAGRSCFGENSRSLDPFAVRVACINKDTTK